MAIFKKKTEQEQPTPPAPAPGGQKGVLFDNEIEGNVDGGVFLNDNALATSGKRYLAAAWTVTPVRDMAATG